MKVFIEIAVEAKFSKYKPHIYGYNYIRYLRLSRLTLFTISFVFFQASQADTGIKSLEDLAKQDKIEYGIRDSGQTYSLFEKGTTMLHKHMFAFMKSRETFAPTTAGAVDRVREGGYAFLSEDPILYYMHQRRPCNTVVVRNLLEAKSYGLVLQSQSEWTNFISVVILNVSEIIADTYESHKLANIFKCN